jgi:hypothetical protein
MTLSGGQQRTYQNLSINGRAFPFRFEAPPANARGIVQVLGRPASNVLSQTSYCDNLVIFSSFRRDSRYFGGREEPCFSVQRPRSSPAICLRCQG